MQKRFKTIINQKRTKWGKVLLAFAMAFGATFGFLGRARALPGDPGYWNTTDQNGLSITVVSVSQGVQELVPVWDNSKEQYYFATGNSADYVTVGAVVDGMVSGATYSYYAVENDYYSKEYLTSEDNGQIIYEDLKPRIYFQDEDSCGEHCSNDPFIGEYYVVVNFSREGWGDVHKNIMVRPTTIGSQSIEILSVEQNDTPLALTGNEYQIIDYTAPLEVTYRLNGLEINGRYSVDVGYNDYYTFVADATSVTETRELTLDYTDRHLNTNISLYSSGDYNDGGYLTLYFKIADASFVPLGDIIIDSIEQGGVELVPEEATTWQREYTFTANDAQGLTVRMHATKATADMNYYIKYNVYGDGHSAGYSSDEPVMATGEALEQEGIVFVVPPAFGMSDNSPFTLNFSVTTSPSGMPSYGSRKLVYQDYAEYQNNSDALKIDFYEDENIPRFDALMYYSDGIRVESDVIDPLLHDADHPLQVEIIGEHYDEERTYEITGKVKANGAAYYEETFTATGAELNSGAAFGLTGLTLNLPEFDPSGNTSGYELYYTFSLEIDGLLQSGEMLYAHDGRVNTLITFDGGEVVATGAGGGIGGSMYMTSSGVTLRKTSLDNSKGAVLHYLGNRFIEGMYYDYALYYNDNASEDWWSAPAGTIVDEGALTGEELNAGDLTWEISEPTNESQGVLYTLLITLNNGMVIVSRDYIGFTEAPKIESFKFTADSDSFMQTSSSSYRVARDTDVTATLTGSGFEDAEQYRLWVSYEGYKYGEENEYGYSNPEDVDLTELDSSVLVTGHDLNGGYVFSLPYYEALDEADYTVIYFALSDKDGERPSPWSSGQEEGTYSGHNIMIDYVNEEDVFHDDGFQINEDGTITDVSEPIGPDEPGQAIIDDKTPGDVDVIREGEDITVVSRTPVLVVGFKDGAWGLIEEDNSIDNDGEKTNSYDLRGYDEVKIVLKGDGDMDGAVSTSDTNLINRSLISPSLPPYRPLSDLERIIFDVDGDGEISSGDSNLINRSLISPSLPPYKALEW